MEELKDIEDFARAIDSSLDQLSQMEELERALAAQELENPVENTEPPIPNILTVIKIKLRHKPGHKSGTFAVVHVWESVVVLELCGCHTNKTHKYLLDFIKEHGGGVAEVVFNSTADYNVKSSSNISIEDSLIKLIVNSCPRLINLEFHRMDISGVTKTGFGFLGKLPEMECLIFHTCLGFKEHKMLPALAALQVMELWIENTVEISDEGLNYIAKSPSPRLSRLSIDGCVKITAAGFVQFVKRLLQKWQGKKLGISAVRAGFKVDQICTLLNQESSLDYVPEVESIDGELCPGWGYQPFTITDKKSGKEVQIQMIPVNDSSFKLV